jgi:HSP20 family molecular chaperone IbpA
MNPENNALYSKRTIKTLRIQKIKSQTAIHPRKLGLPRKFTKDTLKEPQPLIDVFQEDAFVTIVAEIAGFNRETLKIDVKDQKLTLQAKGKDRKYYKSLNLPKEVIPNIFHTTYKNGVLEIKFKKACTPQIKKQLR